MNEFTAALAIVGIAIGMLIVLELRGIREHLEHWSQHVSEIKQCLKEKKNEDI